MSAVVPLPVLSAAVPIPNLASLPPLVLQSPVSKRAATTASDAAFTTEPADLSDLTDLEQPVETDKPKLTRKPKPVEYDDDGNVIKKARKPRPPKPEPEYVIPDVEKKTSTFKGRLGYACLNTVLRNKKPAREAIFCSRTLRIDTIKEKGRDYMKELGRQNMLDLVKLIEWNEENVNYYWPRNGLLNIY